MEYIWAMLIEYEGEKFKRNKYKNMDIQDGVDGCTEKMDMIRCNLRREINTRSIIDEDTMALIDSIVEE
jgi:hypothetical protein